jgi:hypothetical protein
LAKTLLRQFTEANRNILRSSLYDWFPECIGYIDTAQEVAQKLGAEIIEDDLEFDSMTTDGIYRSLTENAQQFLCEQSITHLEYAMMLGFTTESIEEIAQAWSSVDENLDYPMGVMEDMTPPRTMSKLTVARLSLSTPLRLNYSSTDLAYMIVKPYARSLAFDEPITAESISSALTFKKQHRHKLSPAVRRAKAEIDYVLYRLDIDACHYGMERLKKLPLTTDGLDSFIDYMTRESSGLHGEFLKACLSSEYPKNIPIFLARNYVQGDEVNTLALESSSYLNCPGNVEEKLPLWLSEQYALTEEN